VAQSKKFIIILFTLNKVDNSKKGNMDGQCKLYPVICHCIERKASLTGRKCLCNICVFTVVIIIFKYILI